MSGQALRCARLIRWALVEFGAPLVCLLLGAILIGWAIMFMG